MLEGVTVVRKCDSPKEVCQLVGRWDGHGKKEKGLRRLSIGRKCNSHQGGVKGIKNEFQLMVMKEVLGSGEV